MLLCFPLVSMTIIYVCDYIILDFLIKYRNTSVICQPECAWLYKTVNMVVFFVKTNENTYQKGEHLCKCTKLSLKQKSGSIALYSQPAP